MLSLNDVLKSGSAGDKDVRPLLLSMLTDIQRKFVLDPSRRKVARCGRRSGKTHAIAIDAIYTCLSAPGQPVLYAGLTRDSAKKAIWDMLLIILEELNIPHTPYVSTLSIDFPNHSSITLFGCDTPNARSRLRGRKFKKVYFDETGFYTAIDPLVIAVLPMLADLGGSLYLTSSPGELLSGFFFDADQGERKDSWTRYHWTLYDNPIFQKPSNDPKYKTRADEELATVLDLEFNNDPTKPGFKREWLGEWVSDDTSLIYPVKVENLLINEMRLPRQQYVMGLDLSSAVSNAIVVGKYSEFSREFHFVESVVLENTDLDVVAKEIDDRVEKYTPDIITAHVGTYSEGIVQEMRRRYRLPIHPVDGKDKSFYQRVFATDLKLGYIRIINKLSLLNEYSKLVKNSQGDEILGQPNFCSSAALALYRTVYQTHLQHYEAPMTDEEKMIAQLEERTRQPEWWERESDG